MKIRTWAVCMAFLMMFGGQMQGQILKEKVYRIYINNLGDKWADLLGSDPSKVSSLDQKFEIIEAAYGYIGYLMEQERIKEADKLVSKTQEQLKAVMKSYPQNGRAHALYGALLSMEIGCSPSKTMWLGPKAISYIDKGTKLDPNEPVAWVQQGNYRYHAPGFFGGDKQKAKEAFQKAVKLFETRPQRQKNDWIYLYSLVWLAKSYEDLGQDNKAIETYRKALEFEPRFALVRDNLLPKALK